MIVRFKRKEEVSYFETLPIRKQKYFSELSTSFDQENEFVVLSILIIQDEIVFLVGKQHGHQSIYLCSSDFFKIVNHQVAPHWVFYPRVLNYNMVHCGEKFDEYSYLGFAAFKDVKNFLELAYDEDADVIKIIQNEISLNKYSDGH